VRPAAVPDTSFASGTGPGVLILLSTYNGAAFIADQVESIRRQTFGAWTLLVRDDGSSDDTIRLVDAMAASDPRIVRMTDGAGNLGPAQSFGALMQAALDRGAEYIAFADQDDVWDADKLELQVQAMLAREPAVGRAVPLLVHTDLAVVDEHLGVIHPSFLTFQGLGAGTSLALPLLLTQNFVTGCTTLINQSLLRLALPLPDVVMHDWWLALCAAALGEIVRCPRATVLYRQHARNAAGSPGRGRAGLDAVLHPVRWWRRSSAAFAATVAQACTLALRMQREPVAERSAEARATVHDYCRAFSAGTAALQRLRTVRRRGVRPRSAVGFPLFFYARVALWSPGRPASGSAAPPRAGP
jgi:rhamnosyltransferase